MYSGHFLSILSMIFIEQVVELFVIILLKAFLISRATGNDFLIITGLLWSSLPNDYPG